LVFTKKKKKKKNHLVATRWFLGEENKTLGEHQVVPYNLKSKPPSGPSQSSVSTTWWPSSGFQTIKKEKKPFSGHQMVFRSRRSNISFLL
jgi:hypothetical protein